MRFEVPQFIEIEDKIFGPFTWRQFVYLAGGIGLASVLLFTLPLFVFVIFGMPLACLAALLAFYPVNNRPFSAFLEAAVYFYKNHRIYYWKKKSTIVYRNKTNSPDTAQLRGINTRGQDINTLARTLEIKAIQK